MWKTKIKIALIQMSASKNKEDNIRRTVKMVKKAADGGAEMILLPECFYFRGEIEKGELRKNIAEHINGATVKMFQGIAKERGIFIVLGSIYEKTAKEKKLYNTAVFIGPDGKRIASYRKKNLFCAKIGRRRIREEDFFSPGKKIKIIRVGDFFIGAAICYDLRFPEMFRSYAKKGCDMIVVPSNFTYETGKAHWEILLRARAVENKCYVLAPNQSGVDSRGVKAYGNSMVVDPWGNIVARAGTKKQEIVFATIDKRVILEVKKRMNMGHRV